MGASCMGFDLRTKVGWKNLKYVLGNKHYRLSIRDVLRDTLMPMYCAIAGHDAYDSNEGGSPAEWACKRCRHYINHP